MVKCLILFFFIPLYIKVKFNLLHSVFEMPCTFNTPTPYKTVMKLLTDSYKPLVYI